MSLGITFDSQVRALSYLKGSYMSPELLERELNDGPLLVFVGGFIVGLYGFRISTTELSCDVALSLDADVQSLSTVPGRQM